MIQIYHLTTEHRPTALGIDPARPRLSFRWRGTPATPERVTIVGSVNEGAEQTFLDAPYSGNTVEYSGPTLHSRDRVAWRVRLAFPNGETVESDAAHFEMGLLAAEDWTAKWIAGDLVGGPRTMVPPPVLRTHFDARPGLLRARLYATAAGTYEFTLNGGEPVGDARLKPGWTDYRKRLRYQTFDVTDRIVTGENEWTVQLGDGWYCGNVEWRGRQMYGDRPAFLGQLELTYEDGTTETIASDTDWSFTYASVLQADLLMGEHHDQRLAEPMEWRSALWVRPPVGALVAHYGGFVTQQEAVAPVNIRTVHHWPRPDHIVDFGQNLVGSIRIRLSGKLGDTARIRYAEILENNQRDTGNVYVANLRTASQTDYVTLASKPFDFAPNHTFHGFRYAEVRLPAEARIEEVTARVWHTDYRITGDFSCSDPLINQLHKNVVWGWKGNSLDVPTDCPQRDERLGWTGDAQVFIQTACDLADVQEIFEKFQQDMTDAQASNGAIPCIAPNTDIVGGDGGPAWSDAYVICPWTLYRNYRNTRVINTHLEGMMRWLRHLEDISVDLVRSHPDAKGFAGFGDWLSIDAHTPQELIGTAFFAYSARLVSEMATAVNATAEASNAAALAARVKDKFQSEFVTRSGRVSSGSQTAYLLALQFDLVPPELRAAAGQELVNDIRRRGTKLTTGFVGSPYMNHVLSDLGRNDVAYDLLHQRQWPSWLYAVTQGATTIWERWDGWTHDRGFQDVGMNSFNHYAYGAIAHWLYRCVAGIDLDPHVAAYERFHLRPILGGGLTEASAQTDSPYGLIRSVWKVDGDALHWEVEVPSGTTANLHCPVGAQKLRLNGDAAPSEVRAGTYSLTARIG